MNITDINSIDLATSQNDVDVLNSKFYSRFNYPWFPAEFPFVLDGDFYRKFTCQDIGDFTWQRIPKKAKIWVAGCGTNQAIFTALKYPEAEILGTDISPGSIEVCKKIASQLNINNLTLELKSLNEITYEERFDYIICTGVIHHNADPAATLNLISKALAKNGILELMVYNYYHRIFTTAFQKAVRLIHHTDKTPNHEKELQFTQHLINSFNHENTMADFLSSFQNREESFIADSLLQPVEYSYTVESLNQLITDCNLHILNHCVNQFDVLEQNLTWNLPFSTSEYLSLSDVQRWQVGNLLLLERSPMLWFYIQRDDADFERLSEQRLCDNFLKTVFVKAKTIKKRFILSSPDTYERASQQHFFPDHISLQDNGARRLYEAVDGVRTIEDIINSLTLKTDFYSVNKLRIQLTTPAFPYLLRKP